MSLINREDAIDIKRKATVDANPEHFNAHQKFIQFMRDAEISSFGKWQWANGFNAALTAIGLDLENLPSVQLVRCKDCKYHSHDAEYGRDWCNRTSGVFRVKPDDFCSRAERRSDEQIDQH